MSVFIVTFEMDGAFDGYDMPAAQEEKALLEILHDGATSAQWFRNHVVAVRRVDTVSEVGRI